MLQVESGRLADPAVLGLDTLGDGGLLCVEAHQQFQDEGAQSRGQTLPVGLECGRRHLRGRVYGAEGGPFGCGPTRHDGGKFEKGSPIACKQRETEISRVEKLAAEVWQKQKMHTGQVLRPIA